MTNDDSRIRTLCLIILSGVALTWFFAYTRPVVIPFVIAVFFYMMATPIIRMFQYRLKFPRVVSILVTVFVFLFIFGGLVFFVISSVENFVQSAGAYKHRIVEFIQWINDMAARYGIELEDDALLNEIKQFSVIEMTRNISGGLLGFIGKTVMVFVFVLFMLTGQEVLGDPSHLLNEIQGKVSRYLTTKFFTSMITGILVGAVLTVFQVELAFMFVVLTIMLNFIPSIGSIIATLLPLPVLLLQFGMVWQLYVVIGCLTAIQFTIGNMIEPKILGEKLDIHPVVIILCLLFWGLVWGVPGMFLAVPITSVIKISLSRIEATKVFADMLGGRLPDLRKS